jgi:hypothetical protein
MAKNQDKVKVSDKKIGLKRKPLEVCFFVFEYCDFLVRFNCKAEKVHNSERKNARQSLFRFWKSSIQFYFFDLKKKWYVYLRKAKKYILWHFRKSAQMKKKIKKKKKKIK